MKGHIRHVERIKFGLFYSCFHSNLKLSLDHSLISYGFVSSCTAIIPEALETLNPDVCLHMKHIKATVNKVG